MIQTVVCTIPALVCLVSEHVYTVPALVCLVPEHVYTVPVPVCFTPNPVCVIPVGVRYVSMGGLSSSKRICDIPVSGEKRYNKI